MKFDIYCLYSGTRSCTLLSLYAREPSRRGTKESVYEARDNKKIAIAAAAAKSVIVFVPAGRNGAMQPRATDELTANGNKAKNDRRER